MKCIIHASGGKQCGERQRCSSMMLQLFTVQLKWCVCVCVCMRRGVGGGERRACGTSKAQSDYHLRQSFGCVSMLMGGCPLARVPESMSACVNMWVYVGVRVSDERRRSNVAAQKQTKQKTYKIKEIRSYKIEQTTFCHILYTTYTYVCSYIDIYKCMYTFYFFLVQKVISVLNVNIASKQISVTVMACFEMLPR